MGVVYRARDTLLNRDVALKTIRSGLLAQPEEVERFYHEARAAAQLHHRHIVPIFDIDAAAGEHYFTMALAPGGCLSWHLGRLRADTRAAVLLVEKVCRAVQHAHEHGILHRDLKPSNILLDEDGEPVVSDFGLAKFLHDDVNMTQSGQRLGTPAYMAPEQAAGLSDRISPRTDVWALGVLLYEVLTGKRPFEGRSSHELSQLICSSDPPRPRRVQPGLSKDLETIILKCLEKEPSRRYESAGAVADDLARWQRGEPIRARPRSWLGYVWRKVKRHPVQTACLFVGVAAVAFAAWWLTRIDPQERARRDLERRLKDGERVVLVGAKGSPAYGRWVYGNGNIDDKPNDGAFALESFSEAYYELVPDPQRDSYVFEADILHQAGEIGLYFMHHREGTDDAPTHYAATLTFADRARLPGQLFLYTRRLRPTAEVPDDRDFNMRIVQKSFKAEPAQWHKLTIKVTPEHISFALDGVNQADVKHAMMIAGATRTVKDERGVENTVRDATFPPLVLRGGLGIYVLQGRTSFQNIATQPLVLKK